MFLDVRDGSKQPGAFEVDGRKIQGVLIFGQGTLSLHDEEPFRPVRKLNDVIRGVMYDQTQVTLVNCRGHNRSGGGVTNGVGYANANIKAEFVVLGQRHFDPLAAEIVSITVEPEDATSIFYDPDAFSFALDPIEGIKNLEAGNHRFLEEHEYRSQCQNVDLQIGDRPIIGYFTGKRHIFSAKTTIGTITVSHCPMERFIGSDGIRIDNYIVSRIAFTELRTFSQAIEALNAYLRFLELVAGRQQGIKSLFIEVAVKDCPVHLNVQWNWPPKKMDPKEQPSPHFDDMPIQAVQEADTFATILTNWLERDSEWREPRLRFAGSFSRKGYSVDRLVAAANIFDLLPDSAIPSKSALPPQVEKAKKDAKRCFRELPESSWRADFLDALGRVGRVTLLQKVMHRAKPIIEAMRYPTPDETYLPEFESVIRFAVDCRHHFVHGGKPKISYLHSGYSPVCFLTDTLEYVFSVSDLIDAGLDARDVLLRSTTGSHPFGYYRISYHSNLRLLKELAALGSSSDISS